MKKVLCGCKIGRLIGCETTTGARRIRLRRTDACTHVYLQLRQGMLKKGNPLQHIPGDSVALIPPETGLAPVDCSIPC